MSASEFSPPVLPDQPSYGDQPINWHTRAYLIFFQGLFSKMPMGSWRWSQDEKLTEISITDQAPIPRERLEKRPAIVTMRGQLQFGNLSLDNMREVDWRTGKKTRTDLVAATMAIACIAKVDDEAEKIGWIAMRHLRTFKHLLQKYGRFHKIGDEISMSPVGPPTQGVIQGEADEEFVMCTVQSPFFFQWTESSESTDAVILREIDAYLSAALAPPDTTGVRQQTVLRPLTVRGMPIGQTQIPVQDPELIATLKVDKE